MAPKSAAPRPLTPARFDAGVPRDGIRRGMCPAGFCLAQALRRASRIPPIPLLDALPVSDPASPVPPGVETTDTCCNTMVVRYRVTATAVAVPKQALHRAVRLRNCCGRKFTLPTIVARRRAGE